MRHTRAACAIRSTQPSIEAEHLHQVAEQGESAATPAILGGTVMAVSAATIVLVLTLALGGAYLATRGDSSSNAIQTAPAFSADELSTLPTDNWITNGGSLANQRYSPLDQIDTSNVSQLNGVWHTHLRGSATGGEVLRRVPAASSTRAPSTCRRAKDDVFAVDAETGAIRWQYKANLDQKISTVCCGWLSRGVALGDGKVYIGQLDGNLVALDQQTGTVAWKTLVMPWQQGYSITSAPLYVDGMVITGISGGEFGIRGRVTAYDAQTGKEVWRFYTIPGPGETGHETLARERRCLEARRRTCLADAVRGPEARPALLLHRERGP